MKSSWPPVEKKTSTGFFYLIFGSEVAFFLILANVAAFGFFHYTEIGRALLDSLVLYPANLFEGKNYICLITSGFIHADLSHLFWNMLGLFVFTRIVDKHLGPGKTLFIYFGSLAISMFASTWIYTYLLSKNVAIIGASGAVMGLLAAAMLLDPFCITYETLIPVPVMIKGWLFLYADLQGFLDAKKDGVSHLVHLFGFLSVALLVYFLSDEDRKTMFMGLLINILSFVAFLSWRFWFVIH